MLLGLTAQPQPLFGAHLRPSSPEIHGEGQAGCRAEAWKHTHTASLLRFPLPKYPLLQGAFLLGIGGAG